jgi:hypothetical protein
MEKQQLTNGKATFDQWKSKYSPVKTGSQTSIVTLSPTKYA